MKYQIGIDIVDNFKFKSLNEISIKRMLTKNEYQEYLNINDDYKPIYLAGRWAAKEAIYKSINNDIYINLINIEILYGENKKPYCSNLNNVSVSISHTKNYSISIALFEK